MKLDLLYEFQPKIGPRARPHPYGQRDAEQQTHKEAIREIQLADRLGFHTVWCVEHHFRHGRSACPNPEAVLGGLALSTENLRLGFGVDDGGEPARGGERSEARGWELLQEATLPEPPNGTSLRRILVEEAEELRGLGERAEGLVRCSGISPISSLSAIAAAPIAFSTSTIHATVGGTSWPIAIAQRSMTRTDGRAANAAPQFSTDIGDR